MKKRKQDRKRKYLFSQRKRKENRLVFYEKVRIDALIDRHLFYKNKILAKRQDFVYY